MTWTIYTYSQVSWISATLLIRKMYNYYFKSWKLQHWTDWQDSGTTCHNRYYLYRVLSCVDGHHLPGWLNDPKRMVWVPHTRRFSCIHVCSAAYFFWPLVHIPRPSHCCSRSQSQSGDHLQSDARSSLRQQQSVAELERPLVSAGGDALNLTSGSNEYKKGGECC